MSDQEREHLALIERVTNGLQPYFSAGLIALNHIKITKL